MNERDDRLDLAWGARAIGEEIGLDERQAHRLLEAGHIPARKVGGNGAPTGRRCASISGEPCAASLPSRRPRKRKLPTLEGAGSGCGNSVVVALDT
jgi:hypothetical protein